MPSGTRTAGPAGPRWPGETPIAEESAAGLRLAEAFEPAGLVGDIDVTAWVAPSDVGSVAARTAHRSGRPPARGHGRRDPLSRAAGQTSRSRASAMMRLG
jgi:hypothetical protein